MVIINHSFFFLEIFTVFGTDVYYLQSYLSCRCICTFVHSDLSHEYDNLYCTFILFAHCHYSHVKNKNTTLLTNETIFQIKFTETEIGVHLLFFSFFESQSPKNEIKCYIEDARSKIKSSKLRASWRDFTASGSETGPEGMEKRGSKKSASSGVAGNRPRLDIGQSRVASRKRNCEIRVIFAQRR